MLTVKLYGSRQGSNTFSGSVLFSIHKRKFITYQTEKTPFHRIRYYNIYPGTYLLFEWDFWTKRVPKQFIDLKLVKISDENNEYGYEITVLKRVRFGVHMGVSLDDVPKLSNPILRMVSGFGVTYYKQYPINTSHIFTEEEVKELLNLLETNNGKYFITQW